MRVAEALNRALHALFAEDPDVLMLGEDLLDPYGGAFKVSKGLSTRWPERVIATPLSEGGFVGVASGVALAGGKAIVEIMFGDFVALAFDPLVNFAAKSVSMYGQRVPLRLVVRCTVGGNRGYGPTHSQSLQKHFLGVPDLSLFELSAFHPPLELLRRMLALGHPAMLFEDKVLYTQPFVGHGRIDELFSSAEMPGRPDVALLGSGAFERPKVVFLAPGSVETRCLAAARKLFVEREIESEILVPSQLYPFSLDGLTARLERAELVVLVEESVEGGTWGAEVAARLYETLWARLKRPIVRVASKASVIPAAVHLEREVVVQAESIYQATVAGLDA